MCAYDTDTSNCPDYVKAAFACSGLKFLLYTGIFIGGVII